MSTTESTRPSALPLMELATSFWAFKTLASAHELGVFEILARTDGLTAAELARALGVEERPAEMLATGCAALGLLDAHGGRYRNSALSAEYLVPGQGSYFGGLVTMFDRRLYAGWDKLTQAVQTNRPTTWDPDTERSLFESADPEMLTTFWDAMHAMSTSTARSLGAAVDLSGFRRLLDVGGGSGAFDIELCRLFPELRATVFELDFVADTAAKNIIEARMGDRVATHVGDFFADRQFPQGHDLHLYSMVMHDWTENRGQELLSKSFASLEPGGAVMICEFLVDDDKSGPAPAALMSLNKLIESEGRNYTAAEYTGWLTRIGFTAPRVIPFEAVGANGVVMASKPR